MTLAKRLDAVIEQHRLLSHPFYKAWTEGRLSREVLRRYAGQYFAQVSAFPRFVSSVHSRCPEISARKVLVENLVDEELHGTDHPELWMQFAEGLGASRDDVASQEPLPETRGMVDAFFQLAEGDWRDGLCALYAYESQIPEISRTKREGLAAFYGIEDAGAVEFFTVHEEADVWHRQVEREALGRVATAPHEQEKALAAAERCLDSLNRVLDGVMRENGLAA